LLHSYQNTQEFSAWHRLNGLDETWHYHEGVDLTIYLIDANGELITKKLGKGEGAEYQIHIPKDQWFAALVDNPEPDAFCLASCVVFPGFDFKNFELAERDKLAKLYPQHKDLIIKLTHAPHAI
jgi:predicted cupin superfamily sugar epimerase